MTVELLNQQNEILADSVSEPCNDGTRHIVTQRTSLPRYYTRMINQGIPSSRGSQAQMSFGVAHFEQKSELDILQLERVASRYAAGSDGGKIAEAMERNRQAMGAIEHIGQGVAQATFYGKSVKTDGSEGQEMVGLNQLYSGGSGDNNLINIINMSGATASKQTRIWLGTWGANQAYYVFPQGSAAGLQRKDCGEVEVYTGARDGSVGDTGNSSYTAKMEKIMWDIGLVVADWRTWGCLVNIDTGNYRSATAQPDIVNGMIALNHSVKPQGGKTCWYMNTRALQHLVFRSKKDVQSGGGLTYENYDGKPVPTFGGHPIRIVDKILDNEAVISNSSLETFAAVAA